MAEKPFRIAIVGGGTAGWLCAMVLRRGSELQKLDVDLTVIESSRIPVIGVGEGTTAVFRGMLRFLGVDEREFLRETEATVKYGIRHRDWRNVGHAYDGPIDDPHALAARMGYDPLPLFDVYCVYSGRSVTEPHLFTYLMGKSRAPVLASRKGRPKTPISPLDHAFHFDQALVGRYLRSKAEGISHLDATVEGAEIDPSTGDIRSLKLEGGEERQFDFYIDCSGFRRVLIGGALGAKWISYSRNLPVNRAMPFWLELDENAEIPPYTLAWAQRSGWMWQIPTQSRMGCGYAYSDEFATPDEAKAEIEAALGREIEPRGDIRIDAGRLENAWIGNCVAAGLAQSFFEPLEATSIHATIVQMMLFYRYHFREVVEGGEPGRERYNHEVSKQVDDFRKFINLHYVSRRDDTPFWRHVRDACIGDDVKSSLETWSRHTPMNSEFVHLRGNAPHVQEDLYYPVLDGLSLIDRSVAKRELAPYPDILASSRKAVDKFCRDSRISAAKAAGHRQYLQSVREDAA